MKLLKLITSAAALLVLQGAFASTCLNDRSQMYDQISQYESINTPGCPFNIFGWGIVNVSEPIQGDENACTATCTYASGPGSRGKACSWEAGNWENSLTCK